MRLIVIIISIMLLSGCGMFRQHNCQTLNLETVDEGVYEKITDSFSKVVDGMVIDSVKITIERTVTVNEAGDTTRTDTREVTDRYHYERGNEAVETARTDTVTKWKTIIKTKTRTITRQYEPTFDDKVKMWGGWVMFAMMMVLTLTLARKQR